MLSTSWWQYHSRPDFFFFFNLVLFVYVLPEKRKGPNLFILMCSSSVHIILGMYLVKMEM